MNFSFAGCGFLGIYHVGVASCLKQHAPHLIDSCQFAGASAGAIVACCLMCGCCLGDCTTFTLRLATKARSYSLGPLHPSFQITKIIREALREVLPDDAHERASGRLHISLTRVNDRKCVIVSEFSSKEELIQALMCSAHVPLYSGVVPPTYRGVRYVDGGLSDNIPVLNEDTISVSPFAGESDICPTDGSANPLHIYLANTSMQCTMGNLYRMSRALFPPHPEILSDMCQQGFDDCLKFLQNNKLLSCVRHLCVRSVVSQIPIRANTQQEVEDGASSGDELDSGCRDEPGTSCEEEDCMECKKKMQVALLDKLPHKVGSALQEACDSVNKGVKAYIYRHRSLRLMSFLATPWFLPVDIGYTYAVNFLEYLPHLPQDIRIMYQETFDLLRYLVTNIRQKRRRYTARFTCQLAITEVNYNQMDVDICPVVSENITDTSLPEAAQSTSAGSQSCRNLNFEFAVDLDSDLRNRHINNIRAESLPRPRCDSASLRLHPHHRAAETPSSLEEYDTFEQCLHISNQMESIMAYHYIDESSGCIKFEEIFSFKDEDVCMSKLSRKLGGQSFSSGSLHKLSKSSIAVPVLGKSLSLGHLPKHLGKRTLSLDSKVKEPSTNHLVSDIEEFVGSRAEILLKEEKL